MKTRRGFSHSTWQEAAEVAKRAGVKQLALFHHDPKHTDKQLYEIEKQCRKVFPDSFLAIEDMEIDI
jgi:ribonuclease BN (tRNA processing enzyme)